MASPRSSEPLRVGIDATPLFGRSTGVGAVTSSIVERLSVAPTIDLTLVLTSWRARQLVTAETATAVEPRLKYRPLRFPARAVHRLWQYTNHPSVSGFDVMHGVNFVVPPAKGAVELVTIHDLTAWRWPELVSSYSLAYPKLVGRAIKRGAHIHAVSHAVAEEILATIEIEPERVHTIPNGLSLGSAELQGDKLLLAHAGRKIAGGPYILCLGTIEPRKDHPGLLEAMKMVWAQHEDIKLVVAGGDGWGTEAYDRALVDLGLVDDDRIVRLGYVNNSDRLALLAGAQCLAYPSLYEGFGLPPLEAMAVDTPVVATNVAAVAEVCGDAAALVPVRDPDALAQALVDTLEGEGQRLKLKGRMRVKEYDWDNSVDQLIALYHRLVART